MMPLCWCIPKVRWRRPARACRCAMWPRRWAPKWRTLRERLAEISGAAPGAAIRALALEQGLAAAQDARLALSQAIAERGPLPKTPVRRRRCHGRAGGKRRVARRVCAGAGGARCYRLSEGRRPRIRGFRDAKGGCALARARHRAARVQRGRIAGRSPPWSGYRDLARVRWSRPMGGHRALRRPVGRARRRW